MSTNQLRDGLSTFSATAIIGKASMTRLFAGLGALAATLLLSLPIATKAQTDTSADKVAVDRVMRDYFEAYSHGDMANVMNFISMPFVIAGPKGFTAFGTTTEALDWYTKLYEAAVKQGYARSQWIDLGVKLLGQSYAIATGTYVRYKTDGGELNRSGGTYVLYKVDGAWKIGVNMAYPVKDAFKLE